MSEQEELFCPLCKPYGLKTPVEILWYDHGDRKVYRCTNSTLRHEFCEHILKATRKDINNFACNSCSADAIYDCQCFDCAVFCGECNSFINCSCSDVDCVIEDNEDKKNEGNQ